MEAQPPTLNSQVLEFWNPLKADLQASIGGNSASLYFRVFGWVDGVVPVDQWREVSWTLQDFAQFYDCPEYRKAVDEYVEDYLSRMPLASFPTWSEVVSAMHYLFDRPDAIIDYMGMRPEKLIDKSSWHPVEHATAFILRLLAYRSHIEVGTALRRNEFQTRQSIFAMSFGSNNPFYLSWDASDKWVAAYLLYEMLAHGQNRYAKDFLRMHPEALAREYERVTVLGTYSISEKDKFDEHLERLKIAIEEGSAGSTDQNTSNQEIAANQRDGSLFDSLQSDKAQ